MLLSKMRVIKSFSSFNPINESEATANRYKFQSLTGDVTLFRLTSHPVVDLSEPGEYYVCDKADVNPDLLDKKGDEMFLITITTNSNNIDTNKSQQECDKLNNPSIVAIKDDSQCEVISATPFK